MKPAEKIKLDPKKVFDRADQLGLTRVELSNKCGYTDAWIYGACAKEMTKPKAELVANVLNVTVDDLAETDQDVPEEIEVEIAAKSVPAFGNLEKIMENIQIALDSVVDEINSLNLIIASKEYRIAEALEAIAKGINEPWTEEQNDRTDIKKA